MFNAHAAAARLCEERPPAAAGLAADAASPTRGGGGAAPGRSAAAARRRPLTTVPVLDQLPPPARRRRASCRCERRRHLRAYAVLADAEGAAILVPVGVPAAAMPGAAALGACPKTASPPCAGGVVASGRDDRGRDAPPRPPSPSAATRARAAGAAPARRAPSRPRPTATVVLNNPNALRKWRSWRWLARAREEGEALPDRRRAFGGRSRGRRAVEIRSPRSATRAGLLRRALLFGVMPHGNERRLPLSLPVRGPDVRLAQRSSTLSLVPFGETRTVSLTFKNHSATAAAWMIAPAPLPRGPFPQAAAAAQDGGSAASHGDKTYDAAKRAMEFGWGWADAPVGGGSAVWARPQRVAAALAAAVPRRASSVLSSAMGIVEAGAETTVQVTIDAAAEQSVRRVLALRVRHSPPVTCPCTPRSSRGARACRRRRCRWATHTCRWRRVESSSCATSRGSRPTSAGGPRMPKPSRRGSRSRIEPPSVTLAPAEEPTVTDRGHLAGSGRPERPRRLRAPRRHRHNPSAFGSRRRCRVSSSRTKSCARRPEAARARAVALANDGRRPRVVRAAGSTSVYRRRASTRQALVLIVRNHSRCRRASR